jgi:hypothetical protein
VRACGMGCTSRPGTAVDVRFDGSEGIEYRPEARETTNGRRTIGVQFIVRVKVRAGVAHTAIGLPRAKVGYIRSSVPFSGRVSACRAGRCKGGQKPDKTRLARESRVTPRRLRCYGACYGQGYGGAAVKQRKLGRCRQKLGSSTGTGKRWERSRNPLRRRIPRAAPVGPRVQGGRGALPARGGA